ncbi:related to postreplication repair protein uvsH/nuvA [Ustilago bromivora]|uniref:Related to postreplication repair protein uvsH/nuvA n=1 Tax=Ustilago bromivora TaxID=307758 RepID=A0A8H8TTI6_9BASI|nr:related to postreplication repair protein uvsH/nuvA [Ustilago bromivora]
MQATVAHLMDHVTDPSDWKEDFTVLRNLDASLRCDLCFTKAYDSELIPQPLLEITALEWKRSRSFLARLQSHHHHPHPTRHKQSCPPQTESSPKRPPSQHNRSSSPRRSKRIKPDLCNSHPLPIHDDQEQDLIHNTDPEHDADPSAVGSSPSPSPSLQDATGRASDLQLKADHLVECPICTHKFTVTALNRHLDSANCYPGFPQPSPQERGLASTTTTKSTCSWFTQPRCSSISASSDAANEKRLVRPQYNLKSERELRKLLQDASLPTNGDREKMVQRHRQWLNIWNANLDSTNARRSLPQLRQELAAWERTKASAKDHSVLVDRHKSTWVQKSNKSQFDELVQKAKIATTASSSSHATTQSPLTTPNPTRQANSETDGHLLTSTPAQP